MAAPARTYTTTILVDPDGSSMTAIPVPFSAKDLFGKARAPVIVTIGRHSYRSTICVMGAEQFIPLRKSHRDAAGVRGGQTVEVTLTKDEHPRVVTPPKDLLVAIKRAGALESWRALSFTHQREHVEAVCEAKKPETRARRIARCVEMVTAKSPPKGRKKAQGRGKLAPASTLRSKAIGKPSGDRKRARTR